MGHRQDALAAQRVKDAAKIPSHVGGSFAPPLDEAGLVDYERLAKAAEPVVRDVMTTLIKMVRTFQETPKSKVKGQPHPSGRGMIVPLEPEEVKRIDQAVPWKHELDAMGGVFEAIDPVREKALRNAAFHLLWYGYELTNDREPPTSDTL